MHHPESHVGFALLIYAFLFLLMVSYMIAVYKTNKKYKKWPVTRIVFWIMGVFTVFLGGVGPIAEQAHTNFTAHMMTHLLLGMLGPLLLVLAAPMTLLLRSVPVKFGRVISKLLKSTYVRWISHPVIASTLNVGGLWILYATDLYRVMHTSMLLFVLVHVHVFLAGYVFTLSMIYIEVTPHRTNVRLRAIILILAMATHGILSKWLYANPPIGVDSAEAQQGAMLMYYGGDIIDLAIVIILCTQYFRGRTTMRERSYTFIKT